MKATSIMIRPSVRFSPSVKYSRVSRPSNAILLAAPAIALLVPLLTGSNSGVCRAQGKDHSGGGPSIYIGDFAEEPSLATLLRRLQEDDTPRPEADDQQAAGDRAEADQGSSEDDDSAASADGDKNADDRKAGEKKGDEKKADDKKADKKDDQTEDKPKQWYEKLRVRGYAQLRINDVPRIAEGSAPAHYVGDSSVGDDESFLLRRARVILQGDVTDHASIYLQPDFASSVPGSPDSIYFAQIRDWYADLHFDTTKEFRIRAGQSKVPFGWENMQSSSNRLPLDRNDPLNSAVKNERDLGVFFYWTPEYAQEFFQSVLDDGLKGSGNYGMLGLGFYNGQGGSLREQNDNLHFVARYQVPITLPNCQRMELGIQGYTGRYTVLSSPISPLGIGPTARPLGTLETGNQAGLRDERLAGTFVYYPEPWGFQTEWNTGRGPALNDAQTDVIVQDLHGGYAMTMYRIKTEHYGEWFPFYRYQYFRGGYKSERNAPLSRIDEHEIGVEWQLNQAMELTTMYTFTDRTNTQAMSTAGMRSYDQFVGHLMRFQFQFNY